MDEPVGPSMQIRIGRGVCVATIEKLCVRVCVCVCGRAHVCVCVCVCRVYVRGCMCVYIIALQIKLLVDTYKYMLL